MKCSLRIWRGFQRFGVSSSACHVAVYLGWCHAEWFNMHALLYIYYIVLPHDSVFSWYFGLKNAFDFGKGANWYWLVHETTNKSNIDSLENVPQLQTHTHTHTHTQTHTHTPICMLCTTYSIQHNSLQFLVAINTSGIKTTFIPFHTHCNRAVENWLINAYFHMFLCTTVLICKLLFKVCIQGRSHHFRNEWDRISSVIPSFLTFI